MNNGPMPDVIYPAHMHRYTICCFHSKEVVKARLMLLLISSHSIYWEATYTTFWASVMMLHHTCLIIVTQEPANMP